MGESATSGAWYLGLGDEVGWTDQEGDKAEKPSPGTDGSPGEPVGGGNAE